MSTRAGDEVVQAYLVFPKLPCALPVFFDTFYRNYFQEADASYTVSLALNLSGSRSTTAVRG